jgi:hypothetical protein
MKKNLLIIVCLGAMCFAQDQVQVGSWPDRKGELVVTPIVPERTPEGSSAPGHKGTWSYDDTGPYLYIWVADGVAFRITGAYFGQSRIMTVDDTFFKTIAGENLRTVEDYAP